MSLGDLGSLGWRGEYSYDSPEVVALRSKLQQHAGIAGLEIVDPDSDPDFAQRAAALFHRDGFCVVANVLDEERLAKIRKGCAETIREMLKLDPDMAGNRGSHRYTFGTAPAHFGQQAAWATLIDPPRTLAVLAAIFGSEDFHQTSSASGGDFVLPGTCSAQHGHAAAGHSEPFVCVCACACVCARARPSAEMALASRRLRGVPAPTLGWDDC